MNYSALLFDLDGTLIDTIDLYEKAMTRALLSYDIPVTTEKFFRWYTDPVSNEKIFEEHGKDPGLVEDYRKKRDELYIDLLCESGWRDGAEDILKFYKGKSPLAMITGSWKSYLEAIEKCLNFQSYFDTIVAADDMGKFHKPHPHSLLLAADRLNVDPTDCIYIGDQRMDIGAAKNAGMASCLVISKHTPPDIIGKADMQVRDLKDLMTLL